MLVKSSFSCLDMKLDFFVRLLLIMIICLSYTLGQARTSNFGIGAVVGQPKGLSLQVPITSYATFNSSLYYDLLAPRIDVHLDQVIVQPRKFLEIFYPYIGYGLYISIKENKKFDHSRGVLGRIPLGLELGEHRMRGFIELTPALEILPALNFHLQGALGCRYHF